MQQEIFYDDDFFSIILERKNNAELMILTSKQEDPSDEQWGKSVEVFKRYYEEHLTKHKYKYIMLINIENMSLFHFKKIKDITSVLKTHKALIKECCQFTTIVVKSNMVKKILNFGLTFYKNEKPVFFENDYEKVYKSIKEKMINC